MWREEKDETSYNKNASLYVLAPNKCVGERTMVKRENHENDPVPVGGYTIHVRWHLKTRDEKLYKKRRMECTLLFYRLNERPLATVFFSNSSGVTHTGERLLK